MSHELKQTVALVIKEIRSDSGVSQEKLAAAAGLDRTYISGVERGTRNITLDSLEQIVTALDTPLSHFSLLVSEKLKKSQ